MDRHTLSDRDNGRQLGRTDEPASELFGSVQQKLIKAGAPELITSPSLPSGFSKRQKFALALALHPDPAVAHELGFANALGHSQSVKQYFGTGMNRLAHGRSWERRTVQ